MGLSEFLRLAIPSVGLAGLIVLILGGMYGFYLFYQKKAGQKYSLFHQKTDFKWYAYWLCDCCDFGNTDQ